MAVTFTQKEFAVLYECLRRWKEAYSMDEIPKLLTLHNQAWELVRSKAHNADPVG